MIKFQQKKKTERLEELKSAETEKSLKSDQLGFKLNSKGHLIYLNKNKSPKWSTCYYYFFLSIWFVSQYIWK